MKNNGNCIARVRNMVFFFLFFFFCFIGNVLWTENKNKMEKYGEEDEFVMWSGGDTWRRQECIHSEIKHLSYLRQRKNKAMEVYHARETIWKTDLDSVPIYALFLKLFTGLFTGSFKRIFDWNFIKSYSVTFDKEKNFQVLELADVHIFKISKLLLTF